jgi:drug/metabolite transporter (DMT)-like permease
VDRCSAIIMAFLLDYYFFNDTPEYLTIIGICLVILSLVIIGKCEI